MDPKEPKLRKIKLLIGIPNLGDITMETALNLIYMTHLLTANPLQPVDGERCVILWNVHEVRSSNIVQNRQSILDMAVANEVDFLLFIDTDMVFNPEFIFDWLKENRPVIAMNCPTRSMPCYPTARNESTTEPFKGELVYSDISNYRWQKVWRVGTGIMMLRKDAMKSVPRPAFLMRWEPGNDHVVGEDWALCEHLEAAGIPIIIDNEQSLEVKHVGKLAYEHGMIAATRARIAAQSGIVAEPAKVYVPERS